jgi:hypothetical protein
MSQLPGADNSGSFQPISVSNHQQSASIRHPNRNVSGFIVRMVRVRHRGSQEIAEHRGSLGERHAMPTASLTGRM